MKRVQGGGLCVFFVIVVALGCGTEERPKTTAGARLPLSPTPPSAVAELGSDSSLDLDRFGPLTERVQFQVPAYRGIEPVVAITYSSAQGIDGVVGTGWTLLPFATIERKSVNEGVALLRSDDRYFLGGNELVPCLGHRGDAPSCVMGGTHAAKNETFEKIVFDRNDLGGIWTIWNGKGTKTVFTSGIPAPQPVEWQMSEVVDAHQNTATYVYSCIDLHCAPRRIQYAYDSAAKAQYEVVFNYEARPDVRGKGTAFGLQILARRLASVGVTSFGSLVRAYNLQYDASTVTPSSFLSRVSQVGSGGQVGSNFRYSGLSLPARAYSRFTPTSSAELFEAQDGVAISSTTRAAVEPFSMFVDTGIQLLSQAPYERLTWSAQDVDGVEGAEFTMRWSVADTTLHHPDGGIGTKQRSHTWRSPYSGFVADTIVKPLPTARLLGDNTHSQVFRFDLDKDGLPDEILFSGAVSVSRATGPNTFGTKVVTTGLGLPSHEDRRTLLGDFDGDGRTDIIAYDRGEHAFTLPGGGACTVELEHCDLLIDNLNLISILDSGSSTSRMMSINLNSTSEARRTDLSIPIVVNPPFATTGAFSSALPPPEWIALDVDGDQITDLVLAEIVPDGSLSGTHLALRLTTHFIREGSMGLVLRRGPQSYVRNFAPIAVNMAGAFFGADFDDSREITERLSAGDFDGDGRQDLLFLRPTLRSTGYEPSWLQANYTVADLQLSFSILRSSATGFGVAQQIHTGESVALLPLYLSERMRILDFPCGQVVQADGGETRVECAAIRQWVGFSSSVNVLDLNGDSIDDVLIGEEVDLDQRATVFMQDDGHGLPVTIGDSNMPVGTLKVRKLLMEGASVLSDTGALSTAPNLFTSNCANNLCGLRFPGVEGTPAPQVFWPSQVRRQPVRPNTAIPVLHWVFGDLTGDDVTDIAVIDDSGMAVLNSNGFPVGTNIAQVIVIPSTARSDKADRVVEINISAEGIADYLRLSPKTAQQHVLIRTGSTQTNFDFTATVGRLGEISVGDVGTFDAPSPDGVQELLLIGESSATVFFFTHTAGGVTVRTETIPGVTQSDKWILSDLNGDGAEELVRFDYDMSQLTVHAKHRSFTHSWQDSILRITLVAREQFGTAEWAVMNVDGDRFMDFVRLGRTTLSVVSQSIATGAPPLSTENVSLGAVGAGLFQTSDVNGDGLHDFSRVLWDPLTGTLSLSQLINVGTNTPNYGSGRFLPSQFAIARPAAFTGAPSGRWLTMDIEADGLEDHVQVDFLDSGARFANILHRVGEGAAIWERVALQLPVDRDVARLGTWDLNSDGRGDLSTQASAADGLRVRGLRTSAAAARISEIKNGYGLTTEVRYRSSLGHHVSVPSGMNETLVRTLESWVEPTREHSLVAFSYEGFRYDFAERKFRSYETATAQLVSVGGGNAVPTLSIVNDQTEICTGRRLRDTFETRVDSRKYEHVTGSVNQRCALAEELSVESEPRSNSRSTRTRYDYNLYGQLLVVNSDGVFEDYNGDGVDDFSDDNRKTETTYHPPNSTSYLAAFPEEFSKVDPSGNRLEWERFAYDGDAFGAPPVVGNRTEKAVFDDARAGCLLSDPQPPAHCWATWKFEHWPNGVVRFESTPDGIETTTTPDQDIGIFIEKSCNRIFCIGRTWNRLYGSVEAATEANGSVTEFSYDLFGRLSRTTFSDGGCLTKRYESFGSPSKQKVVDGVCTAAGGEGGGAVEVESYFDGLMRTHLESRGGSYEKQTRYWGTTLLRHSAEPWHYAQQSVQPAEMFYDILGRPVRVRYPDGVQTQTTYFTGLRVDHDEVGIESDIEVDGFGNPVALREWNYSNAQGWYAIDTRSRFDHANRRVEVTDAQSNQSTWKYSSLGLLSDSCDPDRGCMQYSYDDGGRIRESQDSAGAVVLFRYDPIGRLETRSTVRRGLGVLLEQQYWDVDPATGQPSGGSMGRPVRIDDETGFRELHYDGRGRNDEVRRCTNAAGQTVCARWQIVSDVASRVATIVYPDGSGDLSQQSERVEYSYDAFSRVVLVKSQLQEYLSDVMYGPDDRPELLALGNGVEEGSTYEPVRQRLTDRELRVPGGSGLNLHYEYDDKGRTRLHSWSDSQQFTLEYQYDSLNRLTEVTGDLNLTYEYDDLGRIVSTNHLGRFEYNDPDHIHAVTRVNQTESLYYDPVGRLQNHDGERYSWNEEGRLYRAKTSAAGIVDFGYEADGERTFKASSGAVSVYFDSIAEFDGQKFKYLYGVGSRVLAERSSSGDVTWNHTDLLGSVRAVSDQQGNIVKRFDYAPYGEDFRAVSSPASFGFSGDRFDEETRLTLMGARYYDSRLGRFVSPDSIVPSFSTTLGLDRYAYGFDSPTVLIDPTGFAPMIAQEDQRSSMHTSGDKRPVRPNAIPAEVWCREHPSSRDCVAARDNGSLAKERANADEAAAVGGFNAEAWNRTTSRQKSDEAEQRALNEGSEADRQRYTVGEVTGFNSAVRAVTADSGARQLSSDEVIEEYKDAAVKLADTVDTTVSIVSLVGGLHAAGKMAASGAERAASACNGACFTEETAVSTPSGQTSIAALRVGDEVLAYDTERNALVVGKVSRLFTRSAPIFLVQLRGSDASEVVQTTEDHPFLLCEGTFVGASGLRPGDCLRAAGGEATVESSGVTKRIAQVYNFEVGELHTYLVGSAGAIVHNACCVEAFGDFDKARRSAFKSSGLDDPSLVRFSKVDPKTGTVVEFKGAGGAKVGYDSPHPNPGPGHAMPHVGWQTPGKGAVQKSGNNTYRGSQHPFRSPIKGEGNL